MSAEFETAGKPIGKDTSSHFSKYNVHYWSHILSFDCYSRYFPFPECTAAVAWAPKEDLKLETIVVAPPKAGEVRIKVLYNSLCHTDFYTLSGLDSEGRFPCILGHEGAGIVESIGEGVTSVKVGDMVVPAYTPECKTCKYCTSSKTNLCPKIRATQGKGLMPDGTTRFTSKDGQEIFHFMGCSTLSQYTVCAEISVVKVDPALDPAKVCLMGCGVTTGVGAALKTAQVEKDSTCAVIGLGGVGLAAIKGCQMAGAKRIFAIDTNPAKFALAQKMGATDCINPKDLERPVEDYIVEATEGGVDFSFEVR